MNESADLGSDLDKLKARCRALLDENISESKSEGQALPTVSSASAELAGMGAAFGLSRDELNLLLCCLAPSLDSDFDKFFSKISHDGAPDVTPDLLAKIFGRSDEWSRFCLNQNSLVDAGLLFRDTLPSFYHSILTRPIRASERLVAFVSGDIAIAEDAQDFLRFESAPVDCEVDDWLRGEFKSVLPDLCKFVGEKNESTLLHFSGPAGTGKLKSAAYLCAKIGTPLLSLKLSRIPGSVEGLRQTLKPILREIQLFGAAVVIPDWHRSALSTEDLEHLLEKIQSVSALVILTSQKPFPLPHDRFPAVDIKFEAAGHSERTTAWMNHVNGANTGASVLDLESVAGLYRFNDGQIRSIIRRAKMRRRALKGDEAITQEEIIAGCREESSQKLSELAVQVQTKHSWDYLILPEEQKTQLRELCNHMKFKSRVYEDWAYHTQVSAPGLNALFTGPPGTGKTLAASVIAGELGLELYKIDLSTIVSKYIGETEKNLSKIFQEAESSNAILFFDEADSLFGKRSAVRDSHDRYANIQVGYLLQKMEEFPGMTILASNLIENIDDAFMRRLHFSVDFPFPAAEERERIWRVSFPAQAPLADDIDFDRLGRRVKVPGGNIRNIALHAAFHAAADDSAITMRHIARAAKREYEKEGRSLDS